MDAVPTAEVRLAGYENVVADCPRCGYECVFNRASDLCTFQPISGADVRCLKCKQPFWLNGDTVNERHEVMLFECHELLERKKYMNCILNICQAYEMFFSLYLRVNLLYVPFGNSDWDSDSLEKLNELSMKLEQKTRGFGFAKMLASFLRLIVEHNPPSTLDEAEKYIQSLCSEMPKNTDVDSVKDNNLSNLLMCIKRIKINQSRNKVVHKIGYRPTRTEAEEAWKEAKSTLFPLTYLLNLHDDANWYRKDSD